MWRFIGAILNGPPLIDEQLGAAAGGWYRSQDDLSTGVNVEIYRISTTDAAAVWLYRQAHGGVNKEWTVTSYELGDGANMATYVGPLNPRSTACIFARDGFWLTWADARRTAWNTSRESSWRRCQTDALPARSAARILLAHPNASRSYHSRLIRRPSHSTLLGLSRLDFAYPRVAPLAAERPWR
jgi:hypothetical protein